MQALAQLREEKAEWDRRRDRFIMSLGVDKLTQAEADLLREQWSVMRLYSDVLGRRIAAEAARRCEVSDEAILGNEPGYRRLLPDELVQLGDETLSPLGDVTRCWTKATPIHLGKPASNTGGWFIWRRPRISEAPANFTASGATDLSDLANFPPPLDSERSSR